MSSEQSCNVEEAVSKPLSARDRFNSLKMKSKVDNKSSYATSTFAQNSVNIQTSRIGALSNVKTLRPSRIISNPSDSASDESTNSDPLSHLSTYSSLPSHLSRNLDAPKTEEVSVIRSKEEEEEDRKLREKEKVLSWDDKQKMSERAVKVREEILATEKNYLEALERLDVIYLQKLNTRPLEELGIQSSHREALVSNLTLLVNFHKQLGADLEVQGINRIEDVFVKYSPFFLMYTAYMNNYQKCLDTLQALHQTKKFQAFLQDVRTELLTKANLDLMSYMIMPVQRVPRYVLLLKELKRNTLPSNAAFETINNALAMVMATAVHINESKRKIENMNTLIEIQHRIRGDVGDLTLIQPYRRLIREGELMTTEPKKGFFNTVKPTPRILFLFNDILVWTNKDLNFKAYMNLASVKVATEKDTPTIFEILNSDISLNVTCPDEATRNNWVNDINVQLVEEQKARNFKRTVKRGQAGGSSTTHSHIVSSLGALKTLRLDNNDSEESVSKNASSINSEPSAIEAPSGYKPRVVASRTGRTSLADSLAELKKTADREKEARDAASVPQ